MEVSTEDLRVLKTGERLNDRIINEYLKLLQQRGEKTKWPTVLAFNSIFLGKFLKHGYTGVERWTKNEDIFKYDIVLIPNFVEDLRHWILVVVDFRTKEVLIRDSLSGTYNSIGAKVLEYLRVEAFHKKKRILQSRKWGIKGKLGPKKGNKMDCGVYLCINAEAYAADRTATFTQRDVPWLRMTMVKELQEKRILSHQKPPPEIPGIKPAPMKKGRKKITRRPSPMFVSERTNSSVSNSRNAD
ncbi:sentrin-specific protease 1-like [Macrosteles quadrilineatus]|uniref:sentrin-specific protease 1-like n=1 Tax=Macrosteles quadrilineatus TaxID=74068 RepID=UPI0023E2BD65|nr:sentrin-specific protease 1-like [Macrosteles quadrilineatus]